MLRSRSTFMGVAAAAVLCSLLSATPAVAGPTLAPPKVIAGPSAAIDALGGLSIGRDGTGGLVYTAAVGGVDHVFVSRLLNGSFQAAEEVDAGLPATASSQPVIAATSGGLVLVAFVNAGELYVAQATSATVGFSPPQGLAAGASNPALSISTHGKGYVAFTITDGAGTDVRAAAYNAGSWTVEPTAMNAVSAGDDAGSGGGRPAVVAAGDGVGIVAWGEDGHIYARRVWGASPSVDVEQADPLSDSGALEVSASDPSVGAGGDSSYADVAFDETFQVGSTSTQTRVLMSRLVAGAFTATFGADGLSTPGVESGDDPAVVMGEYGRGFLLSAHSDTNEVYALPLGTNGAPGGVSVLDPQPSAVDPAPVGGTAGLSSSVAAWQETPIPQDNEVMVAFGTDGGSLGTPMLASDPTDGPTDAASGIGAAGDVDGDAAAAWVQGRGPTTEIVTAQLYQRPGSFGAIARNTYTNNSLAPFRWTSSKESWGPVTYQLTVDGVALGSTTGLSLTPPSPLPDGVYTWQVTATNQAGLSDVATTATVHIDTLAPIITTSIGGRGRAGSPQSLLISVTDRRPTQPADASSGTTEPAVTWGDGTSAHVPAGTRAHHTYKRAGLYRLTVQVADRAGNATSLVRYVRILAAPTHHRGMR